MKKKVVKKRNIQKKEGAIVVSVTVFGSERATNEKIKIRPFITDTANVGVKLGTTINMGDFSSARVDVMVNSPCYVPEMAQVLEQCYKMASNFILSKTEEVKGGNERKD